MLYIYIALLFHMSGFFMLYVGDILVSGFKHCLFSISYMGSSETHWRSPSFFKMVSLPPTSVSNATSFPCHTTSCFFRKSSQCFHRPRRCRTSTSVTAHRRIASRWAMGHGPRLPAGRLQKGVTSGKSQDFGASNHIKYLGFQVFITHTMVSSCLFHMQVCYFGRWGLCSFGILRPFERHGFLDAAGGPGHSKLLPRPWRKRSEKRRKRVTSPGGCGFCQWIGLRENSQEIFNGKIDGFLFRFSLKPIHWFWGIDVSHGWTMEMPWRLPWNTSKKKDAEKCETRRVRWDLILKYHAILLFDVFLELL